jgi:hypothetical protein
MPDTVTRKEINELSSGSLDDGRVVQVATVQYLLDLNEFRMWRDESLPGIALHKFWTTEGWLVTEQEITEALQAYRVHSPEIVHQALTAADFDPDTWQLWIDYLTLAQTGCGFRVI